MPDTMLSPEQPLYRNRSPEIAKLAAALCKAQAAIEGAKKDSSNPHFKTKYADLSSVWDAIRKPLTDNGLSVVQFPRTINNGVEIETTLLHTSGEFMADVLWMPCAQMNAHGVGSAITYGRRYALMAVAGVAPEEDDGNGAAERGTDGERHKPGPAGSAAGGTDFRPPGPRRTGWAKEAENDGLIDESRQKGKLPADKSPGIPINTPAAAGNAIKRIAWVKESVAFLRQESTDEHIARDWWTENKARIDIIETAIPTEYERLLDAYNEALERKVDA